MNTRPLKLAGKLIIAVGALRILSAAIGAKFELETKVTITRRDKPSTTIHFDVSIGSMRTADQEL